MESAARRMKEILKEYEAPNKVRKATYSQDRYKKGKHGALRSK